MWGLRPHAPPAGVRQIDVEPCMISSNELRRSRRGAIHGARPADAIADAISSDELRRSRRYAPWGIRAPIVSKQAKRQGPLPALPSPTDNAVNLRRSRAVCASHRKITRSVAAGYQPPFPPDDVYLLICYAIVQNGEGKRTHPWTDDGPFAGARHVAPTLSVRRCGKRGG